MNRDTLGFTVTAPGAAPGTAMAAFAGEPAAARNGMPGTRILLLNAWTHAQAVGLTQILWQSAHDLVRNVRYRNLANTPAPKLGDFFPGQCRAQDAFTLLEIGSAVAGDVEIAILDMFYEDLPGIDGRLISYASLRKRGINVLTYEDTVTPTAASLFSGARAVGTAANTFKANTDYAVLGAVLGVDVAALTIRGVDSGNMRCAIPGILDAKVTADYFVQQAEFLDLPTIPVFNSSNFPGTFLEVADDENFGATPVSLNLVELAPTPLMQAAEARSQVAAPAQ